MELIKMDHETATVELTQTELMILANAINESREAIEDWEFSTRMGAHPAEAEQLREKLKAVLASLKNAGS